MSTDLPADGAAGLPAATGRPRRRLWTSDLRTARVVRFAVGVTAAAAIAFGFNWPLFFLTPVLAAFFLSLPLAAPTPRGALRDLSYVLVAFTLGVVFTLFLLPYALVYVPALGLILFRLYYLANRGGSLWLVVISLIAVLLLPMLGITHEILASGIAFYFVWSSFLAIVIVFLAHQLFPDPPGAQPLRRPASTRPGYSREAALAALKSTVAILPLATLFISASWTGQILVLVFAAIFSLSPEVSKGKAAGLKSLASTLIGGLAALAFYWLLVAVPEFPFFLALMSLTTLLFGSGIFSDSSNAKYLSSAAIALVILIGSSMGEGVSIADKFITRVVLIGLATLYVVAALAVLDRLFSRLQGRAEA
jgi:hypothetical protein